MTHLGVITIFNLVAPMICELPQVSYKAVHGLNYRKLQVIASIYVVGIQLGLVCSLDPHVHGHARTTILHAADCRKGCIQMRLDPDPLVHCKFKPTMWHAQFLVVCGSMQNNNVDIGGLLRYLYFRKRSICICLHYYRVSMQLRQPVQSLDYMYNMTPFFGSTHPATSIIRL